MKEHVLFATSNKGKLDEAKQLASHLDISLIGINDVFANWSSYNIQGCPGTPPDPVESGVNYHENAAIKARAYFLWSGLATIADDAGLEVRALGGAPGVLSARYAGATASMEQNRELLLKSLEGISDRAARFVCSLAFIRKHSGMDNDSRVSPLEHSIISVEAYVAGAISESERGEGGFGYDNLFLYEETGSTLAELKSGAVAGPIETHRTRALRMLFSDEQFSRY